MQRERVTDDIYVFTSDLYAQVTAGVVVTSEGVVVIDTLAYPEETVQIQAFIHDRLKMDVCYVINTHFHADHTTGTGLFVDVPVIAHRKCRQLLDERGRASLENARGAVAGMADVSLVLPLLTFTDQMTLYLGNKTLKLWHTPGHSPDSIVCLVEEDQTLFAADLMMPIPFFVDGNHADLIASLEDLRLHSFENIVQGHGEVILRGEIDEKIDTDLQYLRKLNEQVNKALAHQAPDSALAKIKIEDCGKSRILLNGMAQQLHYQNVMALAAQRRDAIRNAMDKTKGLES